MEDPSIISYEPVPLRVDAEEYVPKKPTLSPKAKPFIPMDVRLAFHNFVKVLENLYAHRINNSHTKIMYSHLKTFEGVLNIHVANKIYELIEHIEFQWLKAKSCELYGYPNKDMHLLEMTLLIKKLYSFLIKVNETVF